MKQLEMHDYLVEEGEQVDVKIDRVSKEGPTDARVQVVLDGETLPLERREFTFVASADIPSHRLLMEFMPITDGVLEFKVHLTGSQGGEFDVPIELTGIIPQTRYFRFNVEGRSFSLGVGGG